MFATRFARIATRPLATLIGAVVCLASAPVVAENDAATYQLRHSLQGGQTVQYEVTHVAKTKTRINGTEEIANVHTVSTRSWKVLEANDKEATFEHMVDTVSMTQQNGDQDEIRWNSIESEAPPSVFSIVAKQIGVPLATVTINPQGEEVRRENHEGSAASLGTGTLALVLPADPIEVGGTWSVPSEVKVRAADSTVKTIKIRQLFTLEKVKAGVATIKIKSEPLTPIDSESIRSQVVQQLSNGTIRFDVDNGVMLGKELNWDETVVGFQGPGSLMEYRARMTEELIAHDIPKAASKPSDSKR